MIYQPVYQTTCKKEFTRLRIYIYTLDSEESFSGIPDIIKNESLVPEARASDVTC